MRELDEWLDKLVSNLDTADRLLAEELRRLGGTRSLRDAGQSLRNIVLRTGRPVLAVVGGTAQLEFRDNESEVWRTRLQASSSQLQRAVGAVGRINVSGRDDVPYVGTGWLIEKDAVVTNRHVAREFGQKGRGGFTLKKSAGVSIDFLEEAGRPDRLSFPIVEIMHIEDDTGPDFALLRVGEARGQELAPPIPLSTSSPRATQQVAVIGYPARDSRAPDAQLVQSIFGDVFDKKRLAPGQLTEAKADVLLHDCSTLGGNSGSVVLDLATGHAVGLHFAGRFLEANYAVPSAVVAERLEQVRHPKPGKPGKPSTRPPQGPATPPAIVTPKPDSGTDASLDVFVEAVPADYIGRKGYDSRFIGVDVPLPLISNAADVLTFPWDGRQESELKYEHFSVVMSNSRRLCIFSAGNIDGGTPRRFKRPSWRLDPRIPVKQQIKDECYGSEPKFSRGHMTRREDPVWGTPQEASLGNNDSMHVTNTVPQMQPFNGGIWLELESYALDHARSDHMRISVMTGPFLMPDDPKRDGVKIPVSFWKVIAFIHDETGELCATGYTMSQEDFLRDQRDQEFVFGKHKTSQVRIASIERRAGLSFGSLAEHDPFDGDEEGVGTLLTDPGQIRFRRR